MRLLALGPRKQPGWNKLNPEKPATALLLRDALHAYYVHCAKTQRAPAGDGPATYKPKKPSSPEPLLNPTL